MSSNYAPDENDTLSCISDPQRLSFKNATDTGRILDPDANSETA